MEEAIIRNRLKKRSGTVALLTYLLHNLGGPAKAAAFLSKELGEKVTDDRLMLWRVRGAVALPYTQRVAKILKISPYCLNYKAWCRLTGEHVSWQSVVEKCTRLSPIQKKDVLGKKGPEEPKLKMKMSGEVRA